MPQPSFRHLLALGLVLPALLTGCGSDEEETGNPNDDETPEDPGTLAEFAREMLDAHNQVRAGVTPAASPALEPLTWDSEVETTAKRYAAKCQFVHNPERGSLGENLAAATPDYLDTADVVMDWAKEASNYDYASNSCAEGKVCGHYTQVVWRATKRVGCATQVCTQNSPFGSRFPTWQLWVCNYAPPGNYVGQRPY